MDIPTLVDERCRELGITQAELGRRMGWQYRSTANHYFGPTPTRELTNPDMIEEVARHLNLDRDVVYAAAKVVPPDLAAMIVTNADRIKVIRGVMKGV